MMMSMFQVFQVFLLRDEEYFFCIFNANNGQQLDNKACSSICVSLFFFFFFATPSIIGSSVYNFYFNDKKKCDGNKQ